MSPFLLVVLAAPLVLAVRAAFVVWPDRVRVPAGLRGDLERARPVVLGALAASTVSGHGGVDPLAIGLLGAAVLAAGRWSMATIVLAGCAAIGVAAAVGLS